MSKSLALLMPKGCRKTMDWKVQAYSKTGFQMPIEYLVHNPNVLNLPCQAEIPKC